MHFFQVRAYLMLLRVWQFVLARGVALDLATFVLSLLYFTTRIVMVPCAVPEKKPIGCLGCLCPTAEPVGGQREHAVSVAIPSVALHTEW